MDPLYELFLAARERAEKGGTYEMPEVVQELQNWEALAKKGHIPNEKLEHFSLGGYFEKNFGDDETLDDLAEQISNLHQRIDARIGE